MGWRASKCTDLVSLRISPRPEKKAPSVMAGLRLGRIVKTTIQGAIEAPHGLIRR
jgi:hypothetical protein